jgi:hypothetical protein
LQTLFNSIREGIKTNTEDANEKRIRYPNFDVTITTWRIDAQQNQCPFDLQINTVNTSLSYRILSREDCFHMFNFNLNKTIEINILLGVLKMQSINSNHCSTPQHVSKKERDSNMR